MHLQRFEKEIYRNQNINMIRVIFGIIVWAITVFNLIINGIP